MHRNHPRLVTPLRAVAAMTIVATLGGALACAGDSTGVNAATASQLAFVASGTSATASNTAGASASTAPITAGGHTLDLTAVTLTVARAELKRVSTDACPGDDGQGDDHPSGSTSGTTGSTTSTPCGELKVGPTTVDLPLSGNVVTVPGNTIPAGTYRELELRVSQVELKGTFDGKAFDVTIPVQVGSEIQFATPLVVTDGTPTSITVSVPVTNWLVNSDGSLVDPNTIAASPSLSAQIQNRIRASFHAFEDRNHDGHDDHDGGHGDH